MIGQPRDTPRRDHRPRRPARPPAPGRAHRGPDALAAPRPARGRDPAGHHRGGCARRPARRGRARDGEPALPARAPARPRSCTASAPSCRAQEPDVIPVGGVHVDDPDPEARGAHRDRGPRHARAEAPPDGAALLARTPRARAGDRGARGVRAAAVRAHRLRRVVRVGLRPGRAGAHRRAPPRRSRWCSATAHSRASSGRPRWRAATRRCGSTRRTCSGASSWRPADARAAPRATRSRTAFDAAPDRIFFGTDYPAAMGSLGAAARPGCAVRSREPQLEVLAGNAERFVRESLRPGRLDLERALSSMVRA